MYIHLCKFTKFYKKMINIFNLIVNSRFCAFFHLFGNIFIYINVHKIRNFTSFNVKKRRFTIKSTLFYVKLREINEILL